MGTRSAKGLIGIKWLVLNIRDDISSVRHGCEVFADLKLHDDVTVALLEVGRAAIAVILGRGRIDVKGAVILKLSVGDHAEHTSLSFAEKITSGICVAFGVLHAIQGIHGPIRLSYRKTVAFFSEEHCTIRQQSHVPRGVKFSQDNR